MWNFGTDHQRTMYLLDSKQQFGRSFLEVFGFTEGLGAVRDKRGSYYIDTNGKPVSSAKYLNAYPYYNGLAAVEDELGMFHIDHDGNELYSRRYGWVSDFHDDLCAVMFRNGLYTYIDKSGNPMSQTFRFASDFKDGKAIVLTEHGFTHIDKSGSSIHGKHFLQAHNFDRSLAPVKDDSGWHLIDTAGNSVTESFNRIDAGRNGLFFAIRCNLFGYLDKELKFSELCQMVDAVNFDEMPSWSDDILNRSWDSCVVYMRHSERYSHYLCNNRDVSGTGLTSHGDELARNIGNKISTLKDKKITAYCSVSRRCVTTANCIMGGMGVSSPVSISPEVGPNGTAFIYDTNYPEEEFIRPLLLSIYQQLEGKPLFGWYDNAHIVKNIEEMVRKLTSEDNSLTFCVNHDIFVLPPIAILTGKFPRDDWIDYCNGCLFIRRGNDFFLVYKGVEYPLSDVADNSVDISLMESEIDMNLNVPDNVKGWQSIPSETISWQGEYKEGLVALCDRHGRFFHGRSDDYLCYNRTFAWVGDFSEQSAPIYKKGLGASHITNFGDYLHNRWFLETKEYAEGLAPVRTENGWQYVDSFGNIVSEEVFESAECFHHGKALVFRDGKPMILSRNGKITEL